MPFIALAIMAKSPRHGRPKTRLQPPLTSGEAQALAAAFLQDTCRMAQASALTASVACTPSEGVEEVRELTGWTGARVFEQMGNDLSERCQSAFDTLFEQGAEAALLMGADTPHLPRKVLDRAVELLGSPLATHRLVLGPSRDGGYYLIGLRRERRDALPNLLQGMKWSTAAVLSDTLARAMQAGLEPLLLDPCDDIDEPADLQRLLRHLQQTPESLVPASSTRRILASLAARISGVEACKPGIS